MSIKYKTGHFTGTDALLGPYCSSAVFARLPYEDVYRVAIEVDHAIRAPLMRTIYGINIQKDSQPGAYDVENTNPWR